MIAGPELTLRVRDIRTLAPTLKQVTLASDDGTRLPMPQPGAHIALRIAGAERVHRNSYSIVGQSEDGTAYDLIIRRTADSRGGSRHVHENWRVGDIVSSSLPNSQFTPQLSARRHLIIGGGVGITPFLSFLPHLRQWGGEFALHHFARPDEVAVYRALLEPHGGKRATVHTGRTRAVRDIVGDQPLGTHLYTCGPESLMRAVAEAAAEFGWPPSKIHTESFGATGGRPFCVELVRSGRTIAVDEHQTMLEALEEAGVPVASLCRGGACGECRSDVVAGRPDHRDHFLTDEEKASGKYVMPCVSRSQDDTLALDY